KKTKNAKKRPVVFTFNGGTGSPSLWLHLGALGPKRVKMPSDPELPSPPFELIDNPNTWLDVADIVFIDPVGTGFSRAKDKETGEKYWGLDGDIESVTEFIRMWLGRNDRWGSPLYLAGESYGTTRAAGIAGHAVMKGIGFSGIVLVSSILNFQTARFVKGNDLPYILFLPTYVAGAHHHGKCAAKHQKRDKVKVLEEVKEWAVTEYAVALNRGDMLSEEERNDIAKKLSEYTGLSVEYCLGRQLRIEIMAYCKELLRSENRTVGRMDNRYKGMDDTMSGVKETPDHDPSLSGPMAPYNTLYNSYLRDELGYNTDLKYEIFTGVKSPWKWGGAEKGYPDTSDALLQAVTRNNFTRVYIASGYHDLATPFFATEYTLAHMGLPPELKGNFETGYYHAGHMMYFHEPSLEKLKEDMKKFIK
ncbi:MAG: S10 family peptidase, partial [Fimbriimonadaceae bacterium]